MAQEPEYADEHKVWRKTMKDGKPSALQGANVAALKENKEHYPDFYKAIFGEDRPTPSGGIEHIDGLYDKCLKHVNSVPGGEEKPSTIVGEWKTGVSYTTQYGYSIWRVPASRGGQGGGRSNPLLSLSWIYQTTVMEANQLLTQQKEGEIFRFNSMDDKGMVTILKLKKVE